MMSPRPSAPSSGGGGIPTDSDVGHAVNRSAELLSCARSALQMGQEKHRRLVEQQQFQGDDGQQQQQQFNTYDDDESGPNLPEELVTIKPTQLTLYSGDVSDDVLVTDALRLLSALDTTTSTLSGLVRRRGHTNDPTSRINQTVQQFDEMAKELVDMVEQIKVEGTVPIEYSGGRRKLSLQRRRHYELVAKDLSTMADERVTKFKKMLEVREKVIRDQNERRRMLNPTNKKSGTGAGVGGGTSSSAPTSGGASNIAAKVAARNSLAAGAKGGVSQLSSPLFTVSGGGVAKPKSPPPPHPAARAVGAASSRPVPPAAAQRPQHSAPSSLNGRPAPTSAGMMNGGYPSTSAHAPAVAADGYGGGYGGYGGYGAAAGGGYGGMGMRRRANAPGMPSSSTAGSYAGAYGGHSQQYQQQPYDPSLADDAKKTDGDDAAAVQSSIQTRRARRETAARLEEARDAERTLANLGTMFSKMADLVVAQGETITKVEDDVEAARTDVYAGHDEIQKLYGITKGNRGLILKVFGILIFFIIFMRFY